MLKELDALSVTQFHDAMLHSQEWPSEKSNTHLSGLWHWIEENHKYNSLLWNEEDKARRTDVEPAEIATCKRLIDRYNQKRNDAVEAIDEALIALLDCESAPANARLNSETAGAMIDRLSILSLKIFHMREQTQRVDASAEHVASCHNKLLRLMTQRQDLSNCLDQLIQDTQSGKAYFKVYRQFKMYNDPTLNPYLYAKPAQAHQGKAA